MATFHSHDSVASGPCVKARLHCGLVGDCGRVSSMASGISVPSSLRKKTVRDPYSVVSGSSRTLCTYGRNTSW